MLRYFRKDGHNWRKKKDGKTVKEAHERLKVGKFCNGLFPFVFPFLWGEDIVVRNPCFLILAKIDWKICFLCLVQTNGYTF